MDGSTLGFQCRRSPSNEIGCRLGEGIDLVQNDLLIGERSRHRDRHLQCTNRNIDSPVYTPHQFLVVSHDDLNGNDTLLIDRELLLKVHDLLA